VAVGIYVAVPGDIEGTARELMDLHYRAERNNWCTFGVNHTINLTFIVDGRAGVKGTVVFPAEDMF
jgi:hypothetical protein